jgi:hypothetical protein
VALSSSSVSSPVSLSWPFLILARSFWTIRQWWFGPCHYATVKKLTFCDVLLELHGWIHYQECHH